MHTIIRWLRAALLGLALSVVGLAQQVYVRVVDVGAGGCSVIKAPGSGGDRYFIYDAGNWKDDGETAIDAVNDIVPKGSTIELLVLSHSDGDHLGATAAIMKDYKVKRVIHSGLVRSTKVWRESTEAISKEVEHDGCTEINLARVTVAPGTTYQIGDATATFVLGYEKPPAHWGKLSKSEARNAGSIVIRLSYEGKSMLFTGDSVGRHMDDPPNTCIAAEKDMVENAANVTIDSDVIVAPHHGADNGSSKAFIAAVSPKYVIFSAGHEYSHPRKAAAQRYLSAGVLAQNIFRTDKGDDEGSKEWNRGRIPHDEDEPGDDDVEVTLPKTGQISVRYLPL